MKNTILSLDLGVTSCGFAVLKQYENNQYFLIDYGVFMRDNPKQDDSSPKSLRTKYISQRKMIKDKKVRVKKIKKLLFDLAIYKGNGKEKNIDIWTLRGKEAYERKLEPFEYFAILKFLAKHRGYKSLKIDDLIKEIKSKKELKADCDSQNSIEPPKDLENFIKTLTYLDALKCKNQDKSVPQIIYEIQKDEKVKTFRNHNNYRYMIRREDTKKEIELITKAQNKFGFFKKSIDVDSLIDDIIQIIIPQNPVVLNTDFINNCPLIPSQKCAPVYSYNYDLFKLYKVVNDLKVDGKKISNEQKEIVIDYVLSKFQNREKIEFITVKEIKKLLNIFDPDIKLNNLNEQRTIKGKKEDVKLLSFLWFSKMHKFDSKIIGLINNHHNKIEIYDHLALATQTKIDPSDFLYSINEIFDRYKICKDCKSEEIESFALSLFENKKSGTGNYSFEAIHKLLKYMKSGLSEVEAKKYAGLSEHKESYEQFLKGIKYLNLEKYEKDKNNIADHVVKSIVSGALRLIKDLHSKYGSFDVIKIESTRELSIPKKVKNEIEKANNEHRRIWENIKKRYEKHLRGKEFSKTDILKLKLYEDQGQKGIYSNISMGISDVLSDKTEIEHIVPRACGGSSAEYNLALDFKDENATKGNRLPLDYLTGDKKIIFIDKINKMKEDGIINYKKWKNLLAEDLDQTFKEIKDDANMHATSYAEKLLGEVVKMYYPFKDKERQKNGTGVMHISGRATTHLRKVLGVENKSRDTNFHHAEDAIILGLMSRSYLQKLSKTFRENYGKDKKVAKEHLKSIYPTIEGVLPSKIIAKLKELYEKQLEDLPFYKDHNNKVRTINFWVSKKPIGTQAHNETIQSAKDFSYRVPIISLFADVKPKPSHKSKPEEFLKIYNDKVYERLKIVKENPKDFTAIAIKKRGNEVASLIAKYQNVKTKEEKEKADKEIRECFNAPIYDVNGNEIRRVKRIDTKGGGIDVRYGKAKIGESFVCLKAEKLENNIRLNLIKYDIRSSKKEYKNLNANQMAIYRHDLIDLFVFNKKTVELKNSGLLNSFFINSANSKYITFNNPKFPLLPQEKQPKNYGKKQYAIAKSCGIIKYKTDITGRVLGLYRLGKVLVNGVEKESNQVIYESLEKV